VDPFSVLYLFTERQNKTHERISFEPNGYMARAARHSHVVYCSLLALTAIGSFGLYDVLLLGRCSDLPPVILRSDVCHNGFLPPLLFSSDL